MKRREWQHGEHGVALLLQGEGRHSGKAGGKRALGHALGDGIPTIGYGICLSRGCKEPVVPKALAAGSSSACV
jgi:hypothetical protein